MKNYENTLIRTMDTIENITNYNSKYNLYSMRIMYDYSIDNVIRNFTDLIRLDKFECGSEGNEEKFMEAAMASIMAEVPVDMLKGFGLQPFGCSSFTLDMSTDNGRFVGMGRNYDFSIDTSAMMVYCQPKDGYKSIGFAALDNVGVTNPLLKTDNQKQTLYAPFICLDGMNEEGVSIAVLVVNGEPVCQFDTKKSDIFTSLAIRLVLDRAASTDEAVKLLDKYNMIAIGGRDYHFYISDTKGDGRVVEYNYKNPDIMETVVTPAEAVTNFYMFDDEHYGHGYDRYITIRKVFDEAGKNKDYKETAWMALKGTSQMPVEGDITSNTQWSILFNNSDLTLEIVFRRNWEDVYKFSVRE